MNDSSAPPTRTLVLVRHSKASHDAPSDRERPLTERGQRLAESLAREVGRVVGSPQLMLVSPATRARQTAVPLRDRLRPAQVRVEDAVYESGATGWLELIREVDPAVSTLVVVGHEPTVSSLACTLHGSVGDADSDALARHIAFGVSTATAVVLSVPVAWSALSAGAAHLTDVVVAPR